MRQEIFIVKYSPNEVEETHLEWNGRESDELSELVPVKRTVRKGTVVSLYRTKPSENDLNGFKEAHEEISKKRPHFEVLGFKIEFPQEFTASLEKNFLPSTTMVIPEEEENKEFAVCVHHGIQGWYVTDYSKNTYGVKMGLHTNFTKYGFNSMKLIDAEEQENPVLGDAQDLYETLKGEAPDQRYAI